MIILFYYILLSCYSVGVEVEGDMRITITSPRILHFFPVCERISASTHSEMQYSCRRGYRYVSTSNSRITGQHSHTNY